MPSTFLYTGGTSGKPKAAVRGGPTRIPNAEEKENAMWIRSALKFADPNQIQLVTAPLYHSAPYGSSGMTQMSSGTLVLMQKFQPQAAVELIDQYRVTNMFLPPILLKQLLALPAEVLNKDFTCLQQIAIGGAPCPQDLKERALRMFGQCIFEFYGTSELGFGTLLLPADIPRKPNSCGKIVPGAQFRFCDDNGQDVEKGKPGVLYQKISSSALVEYHKDGSKFQESLHKDDPTWFTVGDVGYLDEEDFLFICDRKVDMIISGGTNIYPAEIEQVLHSHPAIADVAVFGVPDEMYGERVHASVLLHPEAQAPTVADLRAFCGEKLASYKIPKDLSIHTEFPRTPSGKLLKRQLRDGFWKGAAKV
jgi:long-chain acyl-CoA synthetase